MIIKIIVMAICTVLLAVSLKAYKQEYAVYSSMCMSFIILFFAVELLHEIKNQLSVFGSILGGNEGYLWIILYLFNHDSVSD